MRDLTDLLPILGLLPLTQQPLQFLLLILVSLLLFFVLHRLSLLYHKVVLKKIEKLSRTGKGKDPPLTFHTLDFAGQKLYRPMHHCFIIQNAFYIVVFNLEYFVEWLMARFENSLHIQQHVHAPASVSFVSNSVSAIIILICSKKKERRKI